MSAYSLSFSASLAAGSVAASISFLKMISGGAFGPHHGNLGPWPGKVHICPNMLGIHHIVSAAIGFAGNDGDTRHSGLTKRIKQFGAIGNNGIPLLVGAGEETRYVFQYEQANRPQFDKNAQNAPLFWRS